jgi:hypothetical protein
MGPPFSPETPGGVESHRFGVGGLATPPPLLNQLEKELLSVPHDADC